jgi:integrase/recombinase XerC
MPVTHLADYRPKNSSYNYAASRDGFFRWLESQEKSYHTTKNYLCDLDAFAKWFKFHQREELSPELVTSIDLREYKQHLVTLNFKPQSINRKLSTIRTFLTWALETGLIEALPKIPKAVKEVRSSSKWLDRLAQNALLRRVERGGNPRDLGVVQLLVNTGLRAGELCALRWSDVRMSDRKGMLVVRSGKGSKRREIPLNKDARSALLLLGYSDQAGKDTPVVVGQRGAVTVRGLQNILEKYKGDLENFSPHSLRHTFCKNLVDAGVGLEKVAALAGHESLDTTRRYCEPSEHDLARAVELIGEEED